MSGKNTASIGEHIRGQTITLIPELLLPVQPRVPRALQVSLVLVLPSHHLHGLALQKTRCLWETRPDKLPGIAPHLQTGAFTQTPVGSERHPVQGWEGWRYSSELSLACPIA